MTNRSYAKGLSAFASATLISRILGYIRDSLVASMFGGGYQTDAFYAAFKIPNLLRRFLGEGSLTAAFVPVLTDTLHKKGQGEARRLLNSLLSGLLVILTGVVIVGIIFAPQVTQLVSWGFIRDPEKFKLTVTLTRLTFPFLMIISVAALATAVLNACGKFFIPAVAPAGLSVAEIFFILYIARYLHSPIKGLALAAVAGVGLHLIWQLPSLNKEGYPLKFVRPFSHPEVKSVFLLMIPTVVGLCSDQVNSFVDQFCASFLQEGSVTALYNSNRVMQLPLALFGIAVSSVALPALSKFATEKNEQGFKELLGFSLRIANFVLIPSFIGLAVLGFPITQALFQHGHFKEEYSWMTYSALVPYAAGLPAYSATKIMATAFYSHKDTKTPVRIAFWAMAVNAILNFALMWKFKVGGLALATTTAAWFQTIFLFLFLRKKLGSLGGKEIFTSFLYGGLAGAFMGGICYVLFFMLLVKVHLLLRVFISIGIGIFFYFYLAKLLKIKEYDFFVDVLIQRNLKF